MHYPIAGHQAENYLINTDVFEGPLDLLLQLIERAELDITRLALAQVTNQYLEYLHQMTDLDAAEVSAFLVIAAKLIQIKSEALLPRPPERPAGEEDLGENLAQQLLTYRKFKLAGEWLGQREKAGLRTFLRLAPHPKIDAKIDLTGITLNDLAGAAYPFFREKEDAQFIQHVVTIPKLTIQARIWVILQSLQSFGQATFARLIGDRHTRIDMVVTFLAILELVKRRVVIARQDSLFADIELEPTLEGDAEWAAGAEAEYDDLESLD